MSRESNLKTVIKIYVTIRWDYIDISSKSPDFVIISVHAV